MIAPQRPATPVDALDMPPGATRSRAKLPGFALLSGTGWVIDFTLFNVLIAAGVPIFWANLCGATCGVSFVFLTGRRFIFRDVRTSLRTAILCYAAWNVAAILLMSVAIAALGHALAGPWVMGLVDRLLHAVGVSLNATPLMPMLAKIALTPVSMYLNFVAMGLIIERRLHIL